MAKKGKHAIEVYKSWCKRCGICVAFCPAGVLAQDESGVPYVKDLEKCTGCQLCELRCPDFAINVRSPRKKGPKEVPEKAEETGEEKNG
jgi:2-oxoglutarate ferredoxin oxidoreductase subunit delta